MTTVAADQVQYESSVRFRWALVAFAAAILLVVSQLIQPSGATATGERGDDHADHRRTSARRSTSSARSSTWADCSRWPRCSTGFTAARRLGSRGCANTQPASIVAVGGAVLAAVPRARRLHRCSSPQKAHQFVTTGNPELLPEASAPTSRLCRLVPPQCRVGAREPAARRWRGPRRTQRHARRSVQPLARVRGRDLGCSSFHHRYPRAHPGRSGLLARRDRRAARRPLAVRAATPPAWQSGDSRALDPVQAARRNAGTRGQRS